MAEIQQLRDMGFAAAEAEVALREASGNVEQALELLLTGALRSDSPDESPKKTGSVSPKDSEWPELPKKPPPTPSSPSGYGKSDAKPPGLEQDDALGLSLEEICFAAQNLFWKAVLSIFQQRFASCAFAGKCADTANATTCGPAMWPAQRG